MNPNGVLHLLVTSTPKSSLLFTLFKNNNGDSFEKHRETGISRNNSSSWQTYNTIILVMIIKDDPELLPKEKGKRVTSI